MKKRLVSYVLAATMCLTIIPNSVTTKHVHASTPGQGSNSEEGGTTNLPTWRQITEGGANGVGTFISDEVGDPFVMMRTKAVAKTSTYYYNTTGWTLHTNLNSSMNPNEGNPVAYIPIFKSDSAATGQELAYKLKGSSSDKLMFYNHDSSGKVVGSVIKDGFTTQTYKVDRTKMAETVMEKNVPINMDGTDIIMYFSGASRVTRDGGNKWGGPYYSKDQFRDNAGSGLWSAVSSSYPMYFNVPVRFRFKNNNVIAYYDSVTGERLKFEELEKGSHKVSIDEEQIFNDKQYKVIRSVNYPYEAVPEAIDSSINYWNFFSAKSAGKTGKDLMAHPKLSQMKSDYASSWTTDKGGDNWEKVPKTLANGKRGIEWNNTNKSNLFGNTTIVWCEPTNKVDDTISYDSETGLLLKTGISDDESVYNFEKSLDIGGVIYEFVTASTRMKTNITDDRVSTGNDVTNGGTVMDVRDTKVSGVQVIVPSDGIGRAEYKQVNGAHILYYDQGTGKLIHRTRAQVAGVHTVLSDVTHVGKLYETEEVSYRIVTNPEIDISNTSVPVMNSKDINITKGSTIKIEDKHLLNDYLVRVSMKAKEEEVRITGNYIIKQQNITQAFNYKFGSSLNSTVSSSSVSLPVDTYHTYYCESRDCESRSYRDSRGSLQREYYCPGDHRCTISHEIEWGDNKFDWVDSISRVVPNDDRFAGKGTLSEVNNSWSATENSTTVSVAPSLDFTSHRAAVDGHNPTFAKYMRSSNNGAITFLKGNGMTELVSEGLKPLTNYNGNGGSKSGNVSVSVGSKNTHHGRKYRIIKKHSSCGDEEVIGEWAVASPTEYSNKDYEGVITAEKSNVSSSISPSTRVKEIKGGGTGKTTIYQSPKNPISFYPTYKMYANGLDAWVLGKTKRDYVPVDVFEIEYVNSATPLEVSSTWSRDAADAGKLSMKGGYQYSVKTKQPVAIKVTSYIHVPKTGYVENSDIIRSNSLKSHDNLVATLRESSNGKLFSNLPEAYRDDYPAEWKINNPYSKAGDNKTKSRMSMPANYKSTTVNSSNATMSIEALDSYTGGKTGSKAKLDRLLEKKGWYSERFDGFEVVKKVTTININFTNTTQTNFVRNGGEKHNTLARQVQNIPANKHGVLFGIQNSKMVLQDDTFDFKMYTRPFLFDVRGTLYDDRN